MNGRPSTSERKTSRRESRLRFEILNAFADSGTVGLSRSEIVVWLILYRDTKPNGTARTSIDDISDRADIDRQSVSRAVGKLVRRKMLKVVRRGGLNKGPSTYQVFPFPMEDPPSL